MRHYSNAHSLWSPDGNSILFSSSELSPQVSVSIRPVLSPKLSTFTPSLSSSAT